MCVKNFTHPFNVSRLQNPLDPTAKVVGLLDKVLHMWEGFVTSIFSGRFRLSLKSRPEIAPTERRTEYPKRCLFDIDLTDDLPVAFPVGVFPGDVIGIACGLDIARRINGSGNDGMLTL